MLRLLILLNDLTNLPLAITPAERWRSARPIDAESSSFGSLYIIAIVVLGATALIVLALLARRFFASHHTGQTEFHDRAEKAGLGEEETNLMTFAAKLGELRIAANIVATEAVFHKCMHLLMQCQRVAEMSPADKKKILSVVNSAQIKLGFNENSTEDITHIPEGAIVTLAAKGRSDPIKASVVSAQGWELKTQANGDSPDLPAGTQVRARYCQGGSVWEFETEVIYTDQRDLTFAHAKNIRFINRRRFRRAAIDAAASLAPFPFMTAGPQKPPVFYPARLTEIAVSGLVIDAEDFPSIPDKSRLLVLIEPRPETSLSSVGTVLRTETLTSRKSRMVIELTGLSEDDLSKLIIETNLACKQNATGELSGDEFDENEIPDAESPEDKSPESKPDDAETVDAEPAAQLA